MAGDEKVREALQRYFAVNGFAADGGYSDRWVSFKVGPVELWGPNVGTRVAAARYHDLHHLATGYPTTTLGESLIGAWELGSRRRGGSRTAWALDAIGVFVGLFLDRNATARAMRRGRQCRNLFGRQDYDNLLEWTVDELRSEMGADVATESQPKISDWVRVGVYAVAGAPLACAVVGGTVLLQPVAFVAARPEREAKRARLRR